MIIRFWTFIFLLPLVAFSQNQSVTYEECIAEYSRLDSIHDNAKLITSGVTDVGKPLHLFIINNDQQFEPLFFDRNKTVVLINNGIHPGEPDGIDACIQLCDQLLKEKSVLLDSVILCIIPIYNVDGALRRNSNTRANQDGPEEYGFRGNAKNLDLNRDFIKCDSQNALSFSRIFAHVDPSVFVDTHVSNGADYPYTMTLISTQHNKLGGAAGTFLKETMEPALFKAMKEAGEPMCPYVNTMGNVPESGLVDFLETPRFASGYAALFNSIGFITETHMLKPFDQRVKSTYTFLYELTRYCYANNSTIEAAFQNGRQAIMQQSMFYLNYELDSMLTEKFIFKGYTPITEPAKVGTGNRLRYDHEQTWEKPIPYYRHFIPRDSVQCPEYYIVPQAWTSVNDRLDYNHVAFTRLQRDTLMQVEVYYIKDYSTENKPYEGHYVHSNIRVEKTIEWIQYYKGDYMYSTHQRARRFLVETLEPVNGDSYFAWNFFDSVLQQKEWFSDYVFEEKAQALLEADPQLKHEFEQALANDVALQKSHWMQLYWIYKRSPYYEGTVNRYPVTRVMTKINK